MIRDSVDPLSDKLRDIVGRDAVLTERDELLVYECDGLPQHKSAPRAVVFPRSTEEVSEVLRALARERVPFSPRGAGTGLSGGALAMHRGVVIELARMRRLLRIDTDNRLAVVQTGMVNAQLSRAAAPFGLHYAPDPSSQAACTIGGNIAENAGGIHCLKYGTTVDHVLAARVVLAGGEVIELDQLKPGYDLLGVFVGSEGTFGIATEATLRLLPDAPAVRTLLADFTDVDDASRAVSAIIAEGLVPAALEMMDGAIIRAVESSVFAAGLPTDAEAALLVELDGLEAGLDEDTARAESICRHHGARNVLRAADEAHRKKLWAARKGAFGAMGRISPDTMLQDAVVPRSRLPEVLAATYRIGLKHNLRVANVFHAGDGNLHPFLCFDARHPEEVLRVKEAGRELMETCVRAGGSITGEHGVGLDKSAYLPLIFSANDMDTMLRVRAAFDPSGLCNPSKIIPTSRSCGEARGAKRQDFPQRNNILDQHGSVDEAKHDSPLETQSVGQDVGSQHVSEMMELETATFSGSSSSLPSPSSPGIVVPAKSSSTSFDAQAARHALAHIVGAEHVSGAKELDQQSASVSEAISVAPASAEEACEVLRLAARERWAIVPAGAGTWPGAGNLMRRADVFIETRRLSRLIEHQPADLIAIAEAGLPLNALNAELAQAGQWLPIDPPDDGRATIGGVAATGLAGAQGYGYGAPRGFVIGMRVALADGSMVKAGGRVVKNVAGYDLCKLFTGSYGTLGLILELTFKLRPLPAQTATLVVAGPIIKLLRAAQTLRTAKLLPTAMEILSQKMAASLDLDAGEAGGPLIVRFAGTTRAVAYQLEESQRLLGDDERQAGMDVWRADAGLWRALAAIPLKHEGEIIWRAQLRPAQVGPFMEAAGQTLGDEIFASSSWQAGAGDGRVRFISSHVETEACVSSLQNLRSTAEALGGSLVVESAPEEIKRAFEVWGDTLSTSALMRRVKAQLDPQGLFCPGRFAAGI
ncbi:MAG TPA: FAD-linked oxidase C-terminal domain-containing protein [Pyrinomonadaceae bacterium]|jgi:glycolate oxidase subunit GlcD|nr:FAD-linked oxidase C-terminal domain-containing protein [Pyrinomonadaceae bacterium]